MARVLASASSQYLVSGSSPFSNNSSAYSVSGWWKPTTKTATQIFYCLGDVGSSANASEVYWDPATNNVWHITAGGGFSQGSVSASPTNGSWHHFGGRNNSGTSRDVFFQGSKGTNTGVIAQTNINRVYVGAQRYNGVTDAFTNGELADLAIWNVALTDDEYASLAAGVSPLLIRPSALVDYWPLLGRATDEEDWIGGRTLTNVNSATVGDGPRIIVPASYLLGQSAAGGTDYPVTTIEAGTAADASSVVIGYARTATESGTAADASSQVASLSGAVTEAGTATDTVSATASGDYAGTATEAATAADTVANVFGAALSIAESGSATDTSSIIAALSGVIAEAGTAADSASQVAALSGATTESAGAVDTVNGTASGDFTGTAIEAASAADVASIQASLSAIVAEAASAADIVASAKAVQALIAEAVSAADAVSSSAAGDYNVAADELSSAVDNLSHALAAYVAVAESETAFDTVSAGGQLGGVVAELAAALDTLAALTGNTALGELFGSTRRAGSSRSNTQSASRSNSQAYRKGSRL